MKPIHNCIVNNNTTINPIWLMRQAGRYLPEFREIRKKNKDFIELCLNKKMVPEITLQPLRRFDFDAAIIFSDILMIPYALGQDVVFSKGLGPKLGNINLNKISKIKIDKFSNKLKPVYESLEIISRNKLLKNKDLIGFVGAPWTLLVYMINKISPKKELKKKFFHDRNTINKLIKIVNNFIKIHISNQINHGATIIQIFDSWAGLVKEEDIENYIYTPTKEIVDYTKKLNVPVICFPRGIKNYKKFVNFVNPNAISIDYDIDPKQILKDIKIPVQGGPNPKILLGDKNQLKKEASKYLKIFKDHPYIFNLGHGVLPETDPKMVEYLIKFVKDN